MALPKTTWLHQEEPWLLCQISLVRCKIFWAVEILLCLGAGNAWHHKGPGLSSERLKMTILSAERLSPPESHCPLSVLRIYIHLN